MFRKLLLFVLICNFSFAQDLYIDDNTFLYAKDIALFVNNDIRLETTTSNLYLRGDAQLVQNTDIKNSDSGELSIYQNQTTGIYEYNYFCSPVGVTDNSLNANLDFDGTNIHDPMDDTDLSNINSTTQLYTAAYNSTSTELSNFWLYTLEDSEGYYSWQHVFDTGKIKPGYGFTLKGSPNPNNVLDFRGRPNNGTITVSCAYDGTDDQPNSGTPNTAETLTGNPYPSALDLKLFFANSATNQSRLSPEIFFWEQAVTRSHRIADYEGGYGIYMPGPLGDLNDNGTYSIAPFQRYNGQGEGVGGSTNTGANYGANNSRRYAAVGQGFIIQSIGAGGDATFNNSMRLYLAEDSTPTGDGAIFSKGENTAKNKQITKARKTNIIAKSSNGINYKSILETPTVVPEIRIHTHIDNTYYKESVIAFRSNTPDNNTYNRFFDGSNISELANDTYLISSDKALSIKSINYNEFTRLKFGIKVSKNNTPYSVTINNLKDVPESVNIYLFDSLNDTYTDIKNNTFQITLNEGTYDERFEITFNNNNNTLDNTTFSFEGINVFQNNNTAQLNILNKNNLNIKSFHLYDISGREIISDKLSSSKEKYTYPTEQFNNGTYLVKIKSDGNQVFNKKIVISN